MKTLKQHLTKAALIIGAFAAALMLPGKINTVHAASKADFNYIRIDGEGNGADHKAKAGNKYFWFGNEYDEKNDNTYTTLYCSKSKSGKGTAVLKRAWKNVYPEVIIAETNGKYVYAQTTHDMMNKGNILQKNLKTGKTKTYKTKVRNAYYHVAGKKIYLSDYKKKVKVFDMKTKKLKKLKKQKKSWRDCYMIGRKNSLYFFCEGSKNVKVYRYNIKKGKAKLVNTLKLRNLDGRETFRYKIAFEANDKNGKLGTYIYDFVNNKLQKVKY